MNNYNARNLLICILELVIGILLLINPVGFTSGIIVMLGVILTATGMIYIVKYFRTDAETAAQGYGLAIGLIFMLIGLFCAFRSEWFILTFPLLTVLYGILTLFSGIGKVQWAVDMLRNEQKYWFIGAIAAVLTIVFAVLILADPFSATVSLWIFIGVTMIVEAVADMLAFILGRV